MLDEQKGRSMNRVMQIEKVIENGVVSSYTKIEDGIVAGYKTIENWVVAGYRYVEDRFVEAFLRCAEDEDSSGNSYDEEQKVISNEEEK